MDVIGRPSIAAPALLFMSFFFSIYRGTPLIDNPVSCPLILKDVGLYNKVKSRMFHFYFSMSKHPWECVFICNSAYKAQRVDDTNSKAVWAPHECRSCSMSAHKSCGKTISAPNPAQSHAALIQTNQIHLWSHTCSCMFLSYHNCFSQSFSLCPFRPPGVFRPSAVQHRWRLLPRHVYLQQQHRGLQRERSHRHPSQPARHHGWDVSTIPVFFSSF